MSDFLFWIILAVFFGVLAVQSLSLFLKFGKTENLGKKELARLNIKTGDGDITDMGFDLNDLVFDFIKAFKTLAIGSGFACVLSVAAAIASI